MNILLRTIKITVISITIVLLINSNVSAFQKFGTNVRMLDKSSAQISVWGNGYAMQTNLEGLIIKQAANSTIKKGFKYFRLHNSYYSTEKSSAKFVKKDVVSATPNLKYSSNNSGNAVKPDDVVHTPSIVSIIYDRYLLSTMVEFSSSNSPSETVYHAESVLRGDIEVDHYFQKSNNAVASAALRILPPSITQDTQVASSPDNLNILQKNIDVAFTSKNWVNVVTLTSKLINKDPSNYIAFSSRSGALAELHLLHDALWDVNHAIELNSEYKNSYHNRAYIYGLLGQKQNASLNYKTACDLGVSESCIEYEKIANAHNPTSKLKALSNSTLFSLTDKANKDGRWLDAVSHSSQILSMDPSNHIALYNRSIALTKINLPQYALRDVDYAIALQPNFQYSYQSRASIYMLLHDKKNATVDLKLACDMGINESCTQLSNLDSTPTMAAMPGSDNTPTPSRLSNEIKSLLAATDNAFSNQSWNDVIRLSSNIVDQDPGNFVAYSNRSGALAELGLLDDALRDANKAVFLQPSYVNSYHNLGYIYSLMDDKNSAALNYKKACNKGIQISCQEHKNITANNTSTPTPNIDALVVKINAYVNQNNWQEAVKVASKVLAQDSMNPVAFASRAVALARLNLLSYALRDANNSIALQPNSKESYSSRGLVYALMEDKIRSLADYKKGCDLGDSVSCKQYDLVTGNSSTMVASNKAEPLTIAKKPQILDIKVVSKLLEQSALAFGDGKWNEVVDLSNKIIKQDAKNFLAYSNRSGAFAGTGKYKLALQDANQSINLNPDYKNAYHNRAYIHSLMKNNEDASTDYKKACDLGISQSCDELVKLSVLAMNESNIVEESPTHMPTVNELLTSTNTAFALKKWDVVIELSTKIINQDRSNFLAYSNRAGAFSEKGNLKQALKDVNKSIYLNEENQNSYHNRGYILAQMKNFKNAQEDYQKACDMGVSISCDEVSKLIALAKPVTPVITKENNDNVNASVVILLAATDKAFSNKEWSEVVKLSTEIIKRDTTNYLAYSNRSGGLAEQGYLEDALEDVNMALNLNPDYTAAYHNRGYIFSLLRDNKSASMDYKRACDKGISVSCEEYGKMNSVADAK